MTVSIYRDQMRVRGAVKEPEDVVDAVVILSVFMLYSVHVVTCARDYLATSAGIVGCYCCRSSTIQGMNPATIECAGLLQSFLNLDSSLQ